MTVAELVAELVAALAEARVSDFPNVTSARLAALLVREFNDPQPDIDNTTPAAVPVKVPRPRSRRGRPLKLGRLPKGAEA